MKTPHLPAFVLSLSNGLALTALLALSAGPAFADGRGPTLPYRRPAQLQQPIEPTTQAHLDAARRALQLAFDVLTSYDNPKGRGAFNRTLEFGGYVARAREDLPLALAATDEALAYVRAHPEANPLTAGPASAGEPKTPPLPKLPGTPISSSELVQVVDALDTALGALVNNLARDYHGPRLGDIGGHRVKIMVAIGRVGTDLSNGISYSENTRGGSTGIIPLSAPDNLPADTKYGPNARTYLAEASSLLDLASRSLATSDQLFTGDQTQGGNVAKVAEDLQRASAAMQGALAYLDDHPEAVSLQPGPAGPEPSTMQRANVSGGVTSRTRGAVVVVARPKLTTLTVTYLNNALSWLQNSGSRDHHLDDLGGYRGKIMDAIGAALADTLAGIEFTATKDPAANTPPPARQGAAPRGNPAPAPAAPVAPKPTA